MAIALAIAIVSKRSVLILVKLVRAELLITGSIISILAICSVGIVVFVVGIKIFVRIVVGWVIFSCDWLE